MAARYNVIVVEPGVGPGLRHTATTLVEARRLADLLEPGAEMIWLCSRKNGRIESRRVAGEWSYAAPDKR